MVASFEVMLAIIGWEEAGPPRRTSQERDVASWKLGATGWELTARRALELEVRLPQSLRRGQITKKRNEAENRLRPIRYTMFDCRWQVKGC